MEKSSNSLFKTIAFVIIAAITCLLFFGLNDKSKTDMEWLSFGFIMFSEVLLYVSTLISGFMNDGNVTGGDIISVGVLYTIASFVLNLGFINMINTFRVLLVWNIVIVLICLLLFAFLSFTKKKKN